ncbi:SDR family oxidoreductase [Salipiger mucosus]|uniref:NADPH:quinone oxidoreductase 2 n=1 Tax=Salipiger mucosus DSM 16094 TaxID=1123237 RepID=S9RWP4_9RHOB|nr:SDR family oxidoreductase [Salipiger mucosus]EPX78429.1 NADPH:quinone oxidoreductase 2 [Salipiger mucosus DSM 16094]
MTTCMVTGASGQLGALVIDALLARVPAGQVRALVRREEAAAPLREKGVDVRIADYGDSAALESAFSGVDRLLLISSSEVGQRAAQHANVIAAAKAAGVGFIAYTSILRAESSPLTVLPGEHRETEAALAASGLPYALLRNGWYTENYTGQAGMILGQGGMIGAAGDGRISSAPRADYAEAAARVLSGDLPASGTVFELAGDESFTLAEFAAALSELSGQEIGYTDMSPGDFEAALAGAGLPAPVAGMLADSEAGAAKGGLHSEDRTLSQLLGRPTTPWRETLKAAL